MHNDWPLTQEQFGDATGLTAVHVNRMIKALRDEGVILSSKNKIKISDWPRLAKIADFTRGYLHMSGDVKII
ncbi:Crp/Fnr family transcriptional regulator [Sphingomonas sp. 4RDLI-65]|uniref:Crp/Fnr family transcriptional regulator n=1 Tax=Sphingomonas sp. 4RDLI-65 TaxID=3111641 RepID=UPI003C2FA43E